MQTRKSFTRPLPYPAALALRSVVALLAALGFAASPAWAEEYRETQKLTASDGSSLDSFGSWVAVDGDVAVIAAEFDDRSGSAYVFRRSTGGAWVEEQKLTPSDRIPLHYFGQKVAASGDTVIVGATGDDDLGVTAGAAYIFLRNAEGIWVEWQKLLASDGTTDEYFGEAIGVDGDNALIASPMGADESGSVYAFTRSAEGIWTERQKLKASDSTDDANFGFSIALEGNTAIIGTNMAGADDDGAAYIFALGAAGDWSERQKLTASDAADEVLQSLFGFSVALDGDTAIVGSRESAYVFTRSADGSWVERQKLTPSDTTNPIFFGASVALEGDTAVVGASGSAYVFTRSATGLWTEQQKLTASDSKTLQTFGRSVAVTDGTLLITARGDDDKGRGAGAAYVFNPRVSVATSDNWVAQLNSAQVPSTAGIEASCDLARIAQGMPPSAICGKAKLGINVRSTVATVNLSIDGTVAAVSLHCADAGVEGPLVARLIDEPRGETFTGWVGQLILQNDDLATVPSSSTCLGITNIDSLKAAARAGQLYVEAVGFGEPARGQLFADTLPREATAKPSDANIVGGVVDSRLNDPRWVRFWFSRELNFIGYGMGALPLPTEVTTVSLHCAAAGQTGPEIAQLTGPSGRLMPGEIMPADSNSACGLPINTIAAVYAAFLNDRLYVLIRTAENPGGELRGQFWP